MISNAAIVIFTLLSLLVIILIAIDFIEYSEEKSSLPYGLIITLIVVLLVTVVYSWKIPAIEVYRGNTTLEITYKDGVPVDSVVVYKKR